MATSKYETLSRRVGNCSFFLQKTNNGHDATMKHPFMKSIYAKNYDRCAYAAYLWSQYKIFAALEEAVEPLKADPSLAPVYDQQLHRRSSLEADLQYWLEGVELPDEAKYTQMKAAVTSYLHDLDKERHDAKALLCHHFLHNNAVLSGGQFLSGQICAVEGFSDATQSGVSFYAFPGVANPALRVQSYLKAMDTIELSNEDREHMLLVMQRIYGHLDTVFDAAHAIAPRTGQDYATATTADEDEQKAESEQLKLTPFSLRRYTGQDGSRILLSLRGKIIDVTNGADMYGPGGSYHMFAGHDVTRCLALMDLDEASLDDYDFRPESEDAAKSLESWFQRLTSKYQVVGDLVKPMRLTAESLRQYTGEDGGRIFISVSQMVIDVTSGAESYGPGRPYHLFAGRDATKALALMDLSDHNLDDYDFVPETTDAQKSLDSWIHRLTSKYDVVGELVPSLALTLDELRAFDGANGGRILLSLSGKIIDVTEGAASYGPGGSYHLFAGRDVTKNLALMDLSEDSLNQPDYVPVDEDGKKSLASWWARLISKYPHVGRVVATQPSSKL